jgi:hypothetical protein
MPLAESMISSLKSNKSIRLDKSKRFRKTLGGYDKGRKGNFDFPQSTPEMLLEIRKKLKREQQILWLKISIVSVVIITSLFWMLLAS